MSSTPPACVAALAGRPLSGDSQARLLSPNPLPNLGFGRTSSTVNRRACREPDLHARDRLTDRAAVTMRSSALRRAATRSRRGLWLRAASLPDAVDRIERGVFLSRDKLGDTPPTVVRAPKAGGHHPAVREGERPSLRKAQRGRAGDFGRAGHAGTAHLDLVRWCWRLGSRRATTKVGTAGRSSASQACHWTGICAN